MSKKASKKSARKPLAKKVSKKVSKAVAKKAGRSAKPVKAAKAVKPAKKAKAARKAVAKVALGSTPAAPSTAMRDRAIAHARFAHSMINSFASGFADDQVDAQPAGCPNHLLWTLGHLASTASWMNGMLTGGAPVVPENYSSLFGMGSKPVADPAAYPAFAEVKQAYEAAFDTVIKAAEQLDDEALLKPTEQDSRGFLADKLDALTKMAWHEGWHLGQLTDLRRALGLPGVF